MLVRKRIILASVFLAAASGFLAAHLLHDNGLREGSSTAATDDGDVRARLEALQAKVDSLNVALAAAPRQSSAGTPIHRADPAAATTDFLPDESEVALERSKRIRAYEASFRYEDVDPAWALDVESALMESMVTDHILSSSYEVPQVQEIKCRRTMCRMKFAFKDPGDATDWADAYLTELGGSIGRVWYVADPQPNGGTELVMFGFK